MLTEKDYCDYETCVALKELGYVGICDAYYELTGSEDYNRDSFGLSYTRDFIHPDDIDRVAAPLLYQAQKWLREEKDIIVDVSFSPFGYFASMYTNVRNVESEILKERFKFEWSEKLYGEEEHDSYEGALLECIKEAVKILKDNRKQALESENTEYDYGHNVYHEEL